MSASASRPEETALYLANRCVKLESENAKLRELLRWRNTESEVPEENEFCLVIVKGSAWPNVIRYSGTFPWSQSVITHWRPIGPLPKEIE